MVMNSFILFCFISLASIIQCDAFSSEDSELLSIRRQTKVDQMKRNIYQQCPMLLSTYLPFEIENVNGSSVRVTVRVILTRFLGIDDLAKTISLSVKISTFWEIPCSINMSVAMDFGQHFLKRLNSFFLDRKGEEVWVPELVIQNRATELNLLESIFIFLFFSNFSHVSFLFF